MNKKTLIRKNFRDSVFCRDNYTCQVCGANFSQFAKGTRGSEIIEDMLDAHHITSRKLMVNGGYVKENGVTVCKQLCHLLVETWDSVSEEDLDIANITIEDISPSSLYAKIGSSYEIALEESTRLGDK